MGHFFLLMKLYCDNLVDIIFGEGPLGFRIGESSYGNVIVAGFTEKEDQPPFPLQVTGLFSVIYVAFLTHRNQLLHCIIKLS